MTNYDYNKGYRAFKFKKNNNIDQNLPALKTYQATREKTDIFWITNSERVVENIQKSLPPPKESFLGKIADSTSSVLYFPRIVSTTPLGNMSVTSSKVPDEDSMEGMMEKYSLAPINVTPASIFQKEIPSPETPREKTAGPSNSIIKRKTPRDQFSHGETKSKRQNHRCARQRNFQSHHPRNHEIYLRNKKLEECLVIQNGIERSSREKFGQNKLLSREKTEDIINWMDTMPT